MSTNKEFKQWLDANYPNKTEVINVTLGKDAPPVLSDVVVGQFLHLVAIYVAAVVAYVYTAGVIVGSNTKDLADTSYELGYKLGTFVHNTNNQLTQFITTFNLKATINQLTKEITNANVLHP